MATLRVNALKLRIAGKSYNEIYNKLGVPKSTLSSWFKHMVLSEAARARLDLRSLLGSDALIKRNKMQTHKAEQRAREMRASAKKKIPVLTKRDLLIIGAVLYWAEGYKRLHVRDGKERMSHTISFVNSDPAMVKTFMRFLREVLKIPVDAIHLTMRLYPHINEESAREYWMKVTGLPSSRFHRTTSMVSSASKGRRPYNRLPYGTLQVAVYDTAQFHYLLGLIEGVQARM
ncbi:MAG: hypothetical protein Q8P17_05495 [bacterium]|nr:hypothetical protein [bacterium]